MPGESIESLIGEYGIYARFNDYKMIPVFQKTIPEARRQIMRLWERNNIIIPGASAEERARQVIFMVAGPANDLVAVNTAYIDSLLEKGIADPPPDPFYFYRMFIQPRDRVYNLAKQMIVSSFDYLKGVSAKTSAKGVVMVNENPKLAKRAVQRGYNGIGWNHIGNDLRGNMVMRRDF